MPDQMTRQEATRVVTSRLCATFRQEASPATVRDIVTLFHQEIDELGFRLLPKEPNPDQIEAGVIAFDTFNISETVNQATMHGELIAAIYSAMAAAFRGRSRWTSMPG